MGSRQHKATCDSRQHKATCPRLSPWCRNHPALPRTAPQRPPHARGAAAPASQGSERAAHASRTSESEGLRRLGSGGSADAAASGKSGLAVPVSSPRGGRKARLFPCFHTESTCFLKNTCFHPPDLGPGGGRATRKRLGPTLRRARAMERAFVGSLPRLRPSIRVPVTTLGGPALL